jgi:hypothetical protein
MKKNQIRAVVRIAVFVRIQIPKKLEISKVFVVRTSKVTVCFLEIEL